MSEEQVVVNAPAITETTPTAEIVTDRDPTDSEPEAKVEETTKTEEQPAKPKDSGYERRLKKAYKEAARQEARAEFLEKQVQELRPKPSATPTGLNPEDFEFDFEKYGQAVAKAAEESALKRYGDEQQAQTRKQAETQLAKSWESKASKAESKYDDFDEVVGELTPTSHINIAIMQAENGDEIAYYLGQNLGEARRIAALDPISAVREIGRLEAKLLAEPPKAKEPSNAPAPITPVKAGSSANKSIFDASLSQAEFDKIRNAQLKRR